MEEKMNGVRKITVKRDGTGDFCTVSEAFALAETLPAEQSVEIFIGAGTYEEKLSLEKDNVTLIGEDAKKTILTYGDYGYCMMEDGKKRGTFRSYTMYVHSAKFFAKNLTIANTAGYGRKIGQAVALYADCKKLVMEECRLLGRQDTLFTAPLPERVIEPGGFRGPGEDRPRVNGTHYYKKCYVEGDVDFIFGGATAYFDECEIHSLDRGEEVNGYVTAASTPEGREYGYVFDRCRFTSDCAPGTVYLGRPWRNFAKTVILRSELGAHIKAEGWNDWNKQEARNTVCFAEYGTYGEGKSAERVPWSRMLSEEEAELYSAEKVLKELWEEEYRE